MAITNDQELKKAKSDINRLKNAIDMFSYADFESEIVAESALEVWKKELHRLENEIQKYAQAQ